MNKKDATHPAPVDVTAPKVGNRREYCPSHGWEEVNRVSPTAVTVACGRMLPTSKGHARCECGVVFCTTDHDLNIDAMRDAFAGEDSL